MALSNDPFAAADLAARIPEVWTPLIQEQLFAKTVAANFFTDLSPFAADGGDIFHVADIYTNTISSRNQTTQGAEVDTDSPAQVDVTLTVNQHKYIAWLLGDKDMVQLMRSFDFNGVYTRKFGSVLADDLEDSLFALWSGLTTNIVGDTGTVLTDLEIRQSIEKLDAANFDLREVAWFLHPTVFWNQVAGIAKYYDASIAGKPSSFTLDGNFGSMMDLGRGLKGSLYGIPLFISSNVVSGLQTYRNLLAHKDALGFALQTPRGSFDGGKVRVQSENSIRNLGLLTVVDIIYGVAELRDAAAVVVNANTTATQA